MKNAKLEYMNPWGNEHSLSFHPSTLCLWGQVKVDPWWGLGGSQTSTACSLECVNVLPSFWQHSYHLTFLRHTWLPASSSRTYLISGTLRSHFSHRPNVDTMTLIWQSSQKDLIEVLDIVLLSPHQPPQKPKQTNKPKTPNIYDYLAIDFFGVM